MGALITKRVENAQDFLWSSQLRYYWAADSRDADIRICDYRSVYSFEYVGNCGRLVITPLTDRCYVTLTTAIRLFLGGAPAGPAGTGKTETTKDLSRGLGLPCYVFNCSDQMNYQTMADIFRGAFFRRVVVPSRHRRDSSSSEKALGGFLFEFELFRMTRSPSTRALPRERARAIFTGRGDGVGLLRHRRDSSEARVASTASMASGVDLRPFRPL